MGAGRSQGAIHASAPKIWQVRQTKDCPQRHDGCPCQSFSNKLDRLVGYEVEVTDLLYMRWRLRLRSSHRFMSMLDLHQKNAPARL
jgi:hypothetical protein